MGRMHALRLLLTTAIVLAGACGCREDEPAIQSVAVADTVREPVVAGAFYPSDADELRDYVSGQIAAAETTDLGGHVYGLVVPHAGYEYSAHVAAASYAQLAGADVDLVIAIGPSHRVPVEGVALTDAVAWRTPLGEVPIDVQVGAALSEAASHIRVDAGGHAREHSLEVQLPFLQVLLGEFRFVPLSMSDFSPENCQMTADAIAQVARGRSVLLLASADMSHYPAYEDANRTDRMMLDAIASFDPAKVRAADAELMGAGVADLECTLCGLGPVLTVMGACRQLGAEHATVITYANSGDVPIGAKTGCVGYGAVAFVGPERSEADAQTTEEEAMTPDEGELNEEQQARVLELARSTVRMYVTSGKTPDAPADDPALSAERACFVTLNKHGQLRGCIGSLEARQPLGRAIIEAAVSAATQDPRFPPVTSAELDDLHIEVSVLSPMRKVESPDEIVVGKHGVVVRQGMRSGVFLPQVATEQGWDRDTMLTTLCLHKAGLPADAWKHDAELFVFTAQVFGEPED